jgi:hypothetical protein
MMNKQRSINLIYLTAGLIAIAALFHLVNYRIGRVMLFIAFVPYLFVQTRYFWRLKQKTKLVQGLAKKRYYILIALWISMIFTVIDLYPVKFFMLLLIMLDYLLLVQSE